MTGRSRVGGSRAQGVLRAKPGVGGNGLSEPRRDGVVWCGVRGAAEDLRCITFPDISGSVGLTSWDFWVSVVDNSVGSGRSLWSRKLGSMYCQ